MKFKNNKLSLNFVSILYLIMGFFLSNLIINPAIAQESRIILQESGALEDGDQTLTDGSFYDEYTFEGIQEKTVHILLESHGFGAYLILLDPQGNKIAENSNLEGNGNAKIVLTLPSNGVYKVLVNGYGNDKGSYQLIIRDVDLEAIKAKAELLFQQGLQQYKEKQYDLASTSFNQALAFFQEINSRSDIAWTLFYLGEISSYQEQYVGALANYVTSFNIFTEINDNSGKAFVLSAVGFLYEKLQEYEKALSFYDEALSIFQTTNNSAEKAYVIQGIGTSYYGLGKYYRFLGQYDQTINYFNQALNSFQEIEDFKNKAIILQEIGLVYNILGNYNQAITYLNEAFEIYNAIDNDEGKANIWQSLANSHFWLQEYDIALNYYNQTLEFVRQRQDQLTEVGIISNIASVYNEQKKYQEALNYYQQSYDFFKENGIRDDQATVGQNMGVIYRNLEKYDLSLTYFEEALAISKETNNIYFESHVLANIAYVFFLEEKFNESEKYLFQSLDLFDKIRLSNSEDLTKISFFDHYAIGYNLLQQTLIKQNKINQALEIAERGRARALIELLTTRQSENIDPQININPPNITQIQEIAKQQNATLVEYTLISEKEVYIWVIKPTGEINFKSKIFENNQDNIISLIGKSRQQLNVDSPTSTRDFSISDAMNANDLDKLHQILIQPIAEFLPTDPNQKVIFIPHQELFLVPFPALKDDNGTYLIEKHTILTAPSIQTLQLTHNLKENRPNNQGEKLIIGNPKMPSINNMEDNNLQRQPLSNLPYAETEALNIANFFNTQALIGDRATEESIKPRLSNAQIIHLATHGLLYYGDPTQSAVKDVPGAIALTPTASEDGFLTSSEILGLKLKADLVVLSACQTGKGRITGDGVIGLSRSLISAGVPSVLVSLWSVDDKSTSELMIEFYQNLQNGMDKAQALRQAMLTVKTTYANPKYWAAFTLIGES